MPMEIPLTMVALVRLPQLGITIILMEAHPMGARTGSCIIGLLLVTTRARVRLQRLRP